MNPYPPAPPPGRGGASLGNGVVILIAVVAVFVLGTCVTGYLLLRRGVDELKAAVGDGGITLASPAEVTAALAGPKKAYVGHWTSAKGSTLDIRRDGAMKFEKDEDGDGVKEKIDAPIAAFAGADFQVKLVVTLTMHVSTPPHRVGDEWRMTVDDVALSRDE